MKAIVINVDQLKAGNYITFKELKFTWNVLLNDLSFHNWVSKIYEKGKDVEDLVFAIKIALIRCDIFELTVVEQAIKVVDKRKNIENSN